jgi:hypothetical protein
MKQEVAVAGLQHARAVQARGRAACGASHLVRPPARAFSDKRRGEARHGGGAVCLRAGPGEATRWARPPSMSGRGGLSHQRGGEVAPMRLLPSACAAISSTQDESGSMAPARPAPGRTRLRRRELGLAAPGARCRAGSPRGVWSPLPRQLVGGRDPRRWLACRRLRRRPAVSRTHRLGLGATARSPPRQPVARGQLTVVSVPRASSPATAIQARSGGPASGGTGGWSGEQGRGGGEGGGTSVAREAS